MDSGNFRHLDELINSGAKEIVLDFNISLDDNENMVRVLNWMLMIFLLRGMVIL